MMRVLAGVIYSTDRQQILLAQRPLHKQHGGLWEFPGGKREVGESCFAALKRECFEELGIEVKEAQPWITIPFKYPDFELILDVWQVEKFRGEPFGKEQQQVEWCDVAKLAERDYPEANKPILAFL